jgi:hypothetical protein
LGCPELIAAFEADWLEKEKAKKQDKPSARKRAIEDKPEDKPEKRVEKKKPKTVGRVRNNNCQLSN